jgi:CRP/FNR family transcriptional regulator
MAADDRSKPVALSVLGAPGARSAVSHVQSRPAPSNDARVNDPLGDLGAFRDIGIALRDVKCGERLFRGGDRFTAIYAVHTGFFRTSIADASGREQITGFPMQGEFFGIDGIASGLHDSTASALEDSRVAVLPYARLESRARTDRVAQRQLHAVLSRQITQDHEIMVMLGSRSAEARLAAFLLNLSLRFQRRGYSPSEFVLRMTRADIASYLGLTLETVSRLFSRFQERHLLEVNNRRVRIFDNSRLRRVVEQG